VLEIEKTLGISLLCCYYYYTGGVVGVLVSHSISVYVVIMLVNQYRDRIHIWYEEEGNLKLLNTPVILLNVGTVLTCLLA
jgi:hypothetical protein